jgi:hypothetical protein
MKKKRNEYELLVGKLEGKRPFGRLRRRWKNNIRIEFSEIGWKIVDQWWTLVNTVMNLRVVLKVKNF